MGGDTHALFVRTADVSSFYTNDIMKKYNINNYLIYKRDLELSIPESKSWDEYTRNELIIKFMPLVENLARKFATSHQAIGILSINDLIQFGNLALIAAIDKLDWDVLFQREDMEQTLKSFLSKRVKGGIRRSIDICMSDIKIPDWKLNEMRTSTEPHADILLSNSKPSYINDFTLNNDDDVDIIDIMDKSQKYNLDILNGYILACVNKYLDVKEQDVLRMTYGLDCPKHSAIEIAMHLGIEGTYKLRRVRISEIKRRALKKLMSNVNKSQFTDLL
jgi:RNA polymerase sigma factor (sigma-70 family)|tara:strand:+ start:318 stop:1145 length:828 start_codon:yes stop_codon:yes gene_type:complete